MQQFSEPFDWTAPIPSEKRVAELIRVPVGETIKGTIVSDRPWKLETHWHNRRTRPCTAAQGACELCPVAPYRLYFLIAVYLPRKQRPVWVQLTSEAFGEFRLAMRESTDMLGREIEIGRERPTLRAPIWIRIADAYATTKARLPKPLEPHETLARVFNGENEARKRRSS